ncbi:MAG: MFS transporter [Actinomycetota bacterium]|nr:MFS transporter [Actinomycetota bacterium]
MIGRPAPDSVRLGLRLAPMAWAGIAAVVAGVVLHLPMYLGARDMGYRLAGMDVDAAMIAGMVLIVFGLVATAYGLVPRTTEGDLFASRVRVKALDDAPIRPAHVGLLLVMALAVTIDVMKPVTLAFVVPGFAEEYGLKSVLNPSGGPPAALLPLVGITGTVIGSFTWGWLGDRIGRRASILLAGVLFIATAVCGSMPSYELNLVMCFVMGLGVGGMLPLIFTLMAETIPARHRGWLMVLIGGDVAGAYIITSWLSSSLVPEYTWRILWLVGLPTGLGLIALNRWIPESPRFLLAHGRDAEARAVMERYGAEVVTDEQLEAAVEERVKPSFAQLFRPPFSSLTAVVVLLGLGVGLVSFGFQLWIPSNLRELGYTEVTADRILRDSALIGFPLNFLVAWLYGFWSSRGTIVLLAGLTAAALLGFALAGDRVAEDRTLLYVLLIVPIWGISSLTAVLAAYSSEIYPTRVRGRGTGLAAGASKAGGVLVIGVVAAALTPPTIAGTALIGAIPMALAALAALVFGVETRRRRLEEITAREFDRAAPAGVPVP